MQSVQEAENGLKSVTEFKKICPFQFQLPIKASTSCAHQQFIIKKAPESAQVPKSIYMHQESFQFLIALFRLSESACQLKVNN